jgi:membrane protein DedA with SNARE-associated domain
VVDLTAPITEFVRTHSDWAYMILGLTAFGESLFLVGFLVPATPIFLAIGGLIAVAGLDPVPLVASAVIGAIAGDIASYLIGRKSGRRIIYSRAGRPHRTKIAKARIFFRKYGMLSVFFGRFIGPLRCTVPFVAGMTRMDEVRFQVANCASAIVWAPVMLMPGWMTVTGYNAL